MNKLRSWRILLFCFLLVYLASCGSPNSPGAVRRVGANLANPTPTEPTLAAPLQYSYAALGASETYGVGASPYDRGYAYLVAHGLHARQFVDVGIPGTTLDAGYDTELTNALSIRPALCTVFFSVNDLRAGVTLPAFLLDLSDLVTTLRRAHSRVLIIGMPDLSLLPAVKRTGFGGLRQISSSWNAGIRRVAKRTGAKFLDLEAFSKELGAHPNYIAADGLHPSNMGHARLAQIVLSAIAQDRLWTVK